MNPRFNKFSKILTIAFVLMLIWWVTINVRGLSDTTENYIYGVALGILPVLGSLFGFKIAKEWGGFGSAMGKSISLLSLGTLTWGLGTLIFAYYNLFESVAVPYPSLADVAYIISWPIWIIGMLFLSRATGARFNLRKFSGKIIVILGAAVIALVSYYLLIVVARGGVIFPSDGIVKSFFDLAYPVGDLAILTVAISILGLSFNLLGGMYKWPIILILTGFSLNYLSDFSFSLTTTLQKYFVANWVDLLFTTTFFVLALGISLARPEYNGTPNFNTQNNDNL